MTDAKAALVATYLGLLLLACVLPCALLKATGVRWQDRWISRGLDVVLIAGGVALLGARVVLGPVGPLLLSLAFVLPLARGHPGPMLGGLAALPMLAGMTWWTSGPALDPVRIAVFVIFGVASASLPRLLPGRQALAVWPVLAGLFAVGVAALLSSGAEAAPLPFLYLWHHWSTYVAPAQSLLAGAVPFHDFPVQYGAGPMLLVAAMCGHTCWAGTYSAVFACNLLYLLAMGGCCMLLTRQAPRGIALLGLVAMACAVLLWTGFPPDFMGPMVTPSVAGMRFLPVAALLLYIARAEDREIRTAYGGHALWLLGLAWSPEAAFQVTLVWWPYLGLRHAQAIGASRTLPIIATALRGFVNGLLAFGVAASALALAFRLAFGEWPSLRGFTVYIRNPPGLLPANPSGPIWLGVGAAAILALALARATPRQLRVGYACLLGLLSVGSYYLGRSHDNNVLNLFPFVVLALTAALAIGLPGLHAGFANIVLAGLVAWPATFGLHSWKLAWRAGEAAEFGPARIVERIRFRTPEAWALFDSWLADAPGPHPSAADAGAALLWLRAEKNSSPLWVSPAMLLPYGPSGSDWTGMRDIGSFDTLPAEDVAWFIGNSARHFHRTGWLLMDPVDSGPWPAVFARFYDPVEERRFGGLRLIRLVPR